MTIKRRLSADLAPRSFTPWSKTAPQSRRAELSVLVVDGDGVTRKFVESALTRSSGANDVALRVETARDATSALELLQSTLFDVVIVDTELAEMPGLRFLSLLRSEVRFREVAFLFLTADRRVETKIALLDAGADDVLDKPQDPSVLRARVRSVAARRRGSPSRQEDQLFRGEFGVMALPDVVSIFELARRSGRLSVSTRRATGEIQFFEGAVWYVSYGNLTGREAFYAMIVEVEGEYAFDAMVPDAEARNVFGTAAALILDAARRIDEGSREAIVETLEQAPVRRRSETEVAPPATPSIELARQIESELSNELSLGELRLWTSSELQSWTSAAGDDRFHAVVFAPTRVSLAAMMALTAPPNERLMMSALGDGQKAFGATFTLRKGRMLDIVACDVQQPEEVAAHLRRCPDAAILFPPGGDYQNVAPRQRDVLDEILMRIRPTLTVGVGTLELQSKLFEMRAIRELPTEVRVLRPGPRPDVLDLRFVIRSVVTFWGALEK